jgi:hypothetical protein
MKNIKNVQKTFRVEFTDHLPGFLAFGWGRCIVSNANSLERIKNAKP